jgi:branched-chain amino acid aminotransferase
MSTTKQPDYIWLDGKLVPWAEANVHCLTHTLHYGIGVFEGLRAYETEKGAAIYRLEDHTKRLFNSAHIVGMQIPFSREELNHAQREVVRQNNLQSAYIRPMVFYGGGYMGLHTKDLVPHVMVAAWRWDSYLPLEKHEAGLKVRTSSFTRNHVNSVLCKAKANGNYLNSVMALNDAVASGCDEALLLDHQGHVAEGSGQNIFIVRDGMLITPDTVSILEGITRDTIITLARDIGLTVKEKAITRDEVYSADEAFFTGSATELMAICELDHRIIGNGKRGAITSRLYGMYLDLVHGKNEQHINWLTFV